MEYSIRCDYFYYRVIYMSYKLYFHCQVISYEYIYIWITTTYIAMYSRSMICKEVTHQRKLSSSTLFCFFVGLMKLFRTFQHVTVKKGWFNVQLILAYPFCGASQLVANPWQCGAMAQVGGDGYGCKESNLFFLMIETWVVPPPRMPVANEGLGWDPNKKCTNPGGV